MKRSLSFRIFLSLLSLLLSFTGYSQDYREFIKQHNLPKEYKSYLKADSFMEMMERREKYKSGKERKITVECSSRKIQTCTIEEIILGYVWDGDEKIEYDAQTITYYYENQHLYSKDIRFDYYETSISIYFYKNGQVRELSDKNLNFSQRWREDGKLYKEGEKMVYQKNNIETLVDMGYAVPIIDVSTIKMSEQKYNEIRNKIRKIVKGENFGNFYENFTISEWKKFNAMRDLFAKELNSNIFKGKDIYYEDDHDPGYLDLRCENGEIVYIRKYGNPKYSFMQSMSDSNITTTTLYYPNGNLAALFHSSKNGAVGLWAKYNTDGSVIKEVDLSKAFRLTLDSIPAIVKKHATYKDKIKYNNDNVVRIYASNYGKIWKVKYGDYYIPTTIFIDDATGKILEGNLKDFYDVRNNYQYEGVDIATIEKKENVKIVKITYPWDE